MPKQSHRRPPTSHPPADPRIESQIDELQKLHTAGVDAEIWGDGKRAKYGSLKTSGTSLSEQEHQRKARAFAQKYTIPQLLDLFSRCREAGFVLRVAHIHALLPVQSITVRRQLEDLAIKNRWSKTRLRLEIRGKIPNQRPMAGRRPRPLQSPAEVDAKLAEFAFTWQRFRQEMARSATAHPLPLTGAVKDHLAAADKAFGGLAKIIHRRVKSKRRI